MKAKIYGAGSIGNHLAYASRNMGYDVVICDLDPAALERTRTDIYPERYGKWDEAIRLCTPDALPKEDFDVVIIGTPPDIHIKLALDVIRQDKPKILLIEKPLCTPSLEGAQELYELARDSNTTVCVGYNHAIGQNSVEAERLIQKGGFGEALALEAGFKEYWGGIFKAHPWLAGPQDTYLGFSNRGGGATGEHSHAINIWQHFSHLLGKGRITNVSAAMDTVDHGKMSYDRIADIWVETECGFKGYIVQDVVTEPSRKYLRVHGSDGFLEWHVNWNAEGDALVYQSGEDAVVETPLPKSRPDDFRMEIEHIDAVMKGEITDSAISLERGLDTMMVIAAAYCSHKEKRWMHIDHAKGYTPEAIMPA